MDIEEIDVEIGCDGQVQLHVKGISGSACLSLTASLEAALGGQLVNRQMTPESMLELFENPVKIKKIAKNRQARA